MAKQPETRDRFRIVAEVESESLGPLLAQLARMGLQNLGYELITDVMGFKTRRGPGRTSATSVLRAWLSDRPTFTRREALAHCEESGISESAASSAVQDLMQAGEIIAMGGGSYRRADAAPPVPETPTATKTKRGGFRPRQETPNREFLWAEFKDRKKFVPADVGEFFKAAGRPPTSGSSLLSMLTKEGFFTRAEDGVYSPVKTKELPYTPKPSAGVNGSGAAHHG